jgi:phosphoglycolate phosphatase-like HAD superfamily hydrolase
MHHSRALYFLVFIVCWSSCASPEPGPKPDAVGTLSLIQDSTLASWGDSPRQRILDWVGSVTDTAGESFIPVPDRIAVFDNDGTLWPEQPMPSQLLFALDYLRAKASDNPQWSKDPILRAFLVGDKPAIQKAGMKGLAKVMAVSHANIRSSEFSRHVQQWMDTAKEGKFGKRYDVVIYQPMLELMAFLRKKDFKTFIVSGGGADFMRVWAEKAYGIPPYQVVGSYADAKFSLQDSTVIITKTGEGFYLDDKEAKPLAIHRFIGKVPVLCGGNSDGDLAMMQYTASSPYKSLNILLHHTDADREYAYDLKTLSGHLEKALTEATARGWLVVDMKKDFKRIFPFQ